MDNLKQLLKKQNLSGKELGILEISNAAIMFKQQADGLPADPLIDINELQKLVNGIKDPVQKTIYSGYTSIHEWISLYYNIGLSNEQQAQLRYKDLLSYITESSIAEDIYEYVAKLPVIMTSKQYIEETKKGISKWLHDRNGNPKTDTIFDILTRALIFYTNELKEHPRKNNPLKKVREPYKREIIKDKTILLNYNISTKRGYYILPDGRRSDHMTHQEWKDSILTPKMKQFLAQKNNRNSPEYKELEELDKELQIEQALAIWKGESFSKYHHAYDFYVKHGLYYDIAFNFYDDLLQDLSKWDVITCPKVLYDIYNLPLLKKIEPESDYIARISRFYQEFRDLIDILAADIDKKQVFDFRISETPVKSWLDVTVSWEYLFKKNFFGFASDIRNNRDIIFADNKRAVKNGVSVLLDFKNSDFEVTTDKNGNYINPAIKHSIENPHRLDNLFPGSDFREEMEENILQSRFALLDSYYYMKGFNEVISLLIKKYDIPAIEIFKLDLASLEEKIDHLNHMIMMLYKRIFTTDYEDRELKFKKLDVLQDVFQTIDYESINVPERNLSLLEEMLENFKIFQNPFLIEDLALYRTLRPGSPLEGVLENETQ